MYDVSFRHEEFRKIYRLSDVDEIEKVNGSGIPIGKKFKKRINILQSITRDPPDSLPEAFRKESYRCNNLDVQLENGLFRFEASVSCSPIKID